MKEKRPITIKPLQLRHSRTFFGMRYCDEVLHPDYCRGQTAQPLVAGGFGVSYFLWGIKISFYTNVYGVC